MNPLLMKAQMAAEWELAHQWRPLPPPTEGHYLVRVTNDQGACVRLERWDGERWATLGGYATPTGWMALPLP